ncbi:MAG: SMI1/KNR4 family protein [Planctomycetaceae bacterium]|nr:SMI1/KNR4 family protein [Planctomycetaceae bacterium]
MPISELKNLVAPPESPVCVGTTSDWKTFEARIGLRLPKEYCALLKEYGSGDFLNGELGIFNPFDVDAYERQVHLRLKTMRERKERSPEEVACALFPDEGGLYPFGADDNSRTYFWVTDGDPESWPIACFSPPNTWLLLHYSLSEFLVRFLTNRLNGFLEAFGAMPLPDDEWVFRFRPKVAANPKRGKRKR